MKMLLAFVTRTKPVFFSKTRLERGSFPALPRPDEALPRPSSLSETAMGRNQNLPAQALEC